MTNSWFFSFSAGWLYSIARQPSPITVRESFCTLGQALPSFTPHHWSITEEQCSAGGTFGSIAYEQLSHPSSITYCRLNIICSRMCMISWASVSWLPILNLSHLSIQLLKSGSQKHMTLIWNIWPSSSSRVQRNLVALLRLGSCWLFTLVQPLTPWAPIRLLYF